MLQENLKIATDIKTIVQNRLQEGIARKQELNEAEVNEINIQDKIAQLQYVLQQQQLALSVFFENKLIEWHLFKYFNIVVLDGKLITKIYIFELGVKFICNIIYKIIKHELTD